MFTLNLQSREPIYEQLYRKIIQLITLDVLKPGEKLPSVRSLASDLAINPNTVARTYQMLEQNGIIYSVVGKGSFISEKLKASDKKYELVIKKLNDVLKEATELNIPIEDINKIVLDFYNNLKSERGNKND